MSEKPQEQKDITQMRLWEIQMVRDLAWIAGFVVLFLIIFSIRAVIIPVLIGLALAYIVNPAIVWMNKKWRLPRVAATSVFMGAGAIFILLFMLLVIPMVVEQLGNLINRVGSYATWVVDEVGPLIDEYLDPFDENKADALDGTALGNEVGDHVIAGDGVGENDGEAVGIDEPKSNVAQAAEAVREIGQAIDTANEQPADDRNEKIGRWVDELSKLDLGQIGQGLLQALNIGVGVVGSAVSLMMYLTISAILVAFCFFFFSWHFNAILEWFDQFIPDSQHEKVVRIARRMDKSVSAFVRGRLIQSLVMMMILSVGWYFAGVPYFILLGVIGGLLNLVPYAASVGWIAAVVLTLVDRLSGGSSGVAENFTIWILIWPTVVYFAAQLIDGWVVEPIVQGAATELDPLAVLLAVIIGGSLAGLLGLLLAIPTAACLKILAEEVIIPRLRAERLQNGKGT